MVELNLAFRKNTMFVENGDCIILYENKCYYAHLFNYRSLQYLTHETISDIKRLRQRSELPKCYYFSSGLSNPNGFF